MGELDTLLERLANLDPEERAKIEREAIAATKGIVWVPNPGSQMEAFDSEADETGYGGEAGPGKTDLLLGTALTQHRRSLVLRRTNKEASKLQARLEEILGTREGWNGQQNQWRIDGRLIDIGGVQLESDKQKYKGDPHDLIAFDEVVDFSETQYEFIIGWNRSTDPKQRCRILASFNPPTRPIGMWVMKRWAAWLDPKHPNPAKSGELRWFTTVDGEDTEVEGPGPHMIEGKAILAKSRTFIRGRLEENPALAGTGYEGRLAGLPEELRDAYMSGSFEASLRDQPNQTIPTTWVKLAQQRWTAKPPIGVPMCAIGVDCSGGGKDPLIIACRHDGWYATIIEIPGKEIPMDKIGSHTAGLVIAARRDLAIVVPDMGGGYGSAMAEHLTDNSVEVAGYRGAESTTRRSNDGKLKFTNTRSAALWGLREALDPGQPGGSPIALPDDPELVADLTSPTFEATPNGIKVEPKDAVMERLGRSTDKGDAVMMAWWAGPKEITHALEWADAREEMRKQTLHKIGGRRPQAIIGREHSNFGRRRG